MSVQRTEVDHQLESLFHPGLHRRYPSQQTFRQCKELQYIPPLKHPTIMNLKIQCTGVGCYFLSDSFRRKFYINII